MRCMNIVAPLVAAAVLAAPLAVARAQPGLAQPLAPQPSSAPPVDDEDDKSPGLALGLSLLGTTAGYATLFAAADSGNEGLTLLGLGGIVVGPSLGQFYAGETGRAVGHSILRASAGGVMVLGAAMTFAACFGEEESGCDDGAGPILMIGGAVVGIGSTVYSIVDSPAAAVRHNESRRRFVLTPAPVVGPERSTGYGVSLAAQF